MVFPAKKVLSTFSFRLKQHVNRKRRILFFVWLLLIPLLVVLFNWPARKLDNLVVDVHEKIASRFRTPTSQICIIGIDNQTLSSVEQRWPWPRDHFARLLKSINNSSPKYILFDILLQHPQNTLLGNGDDMLAEAIRECGNVVMVSFIEEKIFETGLQKVYYQNNPLFRQTAAFQGLIWSLIDEDGVSRSFVLRDRDYEAESCAVWIAQRNGVAVPGSAGKNLNDVSMLAHARKGGEIPAISASVFFDKNEPVEFIKDKIVILGGTAPILHDYHNTSRGLMSGPRLLATSLDTLLNQRGAVPLTTTGYQLLLAVAAALIAIAGSLLFYQQSMLLLAGFTLAALMAWITCFEWFRLCLPLGSYLLSGWAVAFSLVMLQKFIVAIEQKQLEAEAEAAGNVQKQLFPKQPLEFSNHTISGFCIPCSTAGGDFFEAFEHQSGKSFFAIADVMGHGIPAAMVTSIVKAVISLHRSKEIFSLKDCIEELNSVLSSVFNRTKMVTAIFGLYEPEKRQCELAIAGHPAVCYIKSDGSYEEVGSRCLPLGVAKRLKINWSTLELRPGEALVLYTDGVVEAMNWAGEPYGYDRWFARLTGGKELLSDTSPEALLDDMWKHTCGRAVDDDLTVLVLQTAKSENTESNVA